MKRNFLVWLSSLIWVDFLKISWDVIFAAPFFFYASYDHESTCATFHRVKTTAEKLQTIHLKLKKIFRRLQSRHTHPNEWKEISNLTELPHLSWFSQNLKRRLFCRAIFFLCIVWSWINVRYISLRSENLWEASNDSFESIETFLSNFKIQTHRIFRKSTKMWNLSQREKFFWLTWASIWTLKLPKKFSMDSNESCEASQRFSGLSGM